MDFGYIIGIGIAGFILYAVIYEQYQKAVSNKSDEIAQHKISIMEKALDEKYQKLFDELDDREKEITLREKALNALSQEKVQGFPWLAKAWAEYLDLQDKARQNYLLKKKNPAKKSAEVLQEIRREKRKLAKENKILEYTLEYYESLFPWLTEFKEEGIDELIVDIQNENGGSDESHDEAIHWLSQAEYNNLSTIEKYQKALDRYKNSRSKPWQIGRDYERYIGYKYETEGYKVTYHGIIEGFSDMGRDLICKKGRNTLIIQCKCWAKHKTIHEKHINQLFGTSVMYSIQYPAEKVTPIFVSSTSLSEEAKLFAKALGVQVIENCKYDKDYPIIKCNIAKKDKTKIYHLPFDQQYDTALILSKGECYVKTVAEAEELGFRRAFRWHPDK